MFHYYELLNLIILSFFFAVPQRRICLCGTISVKLVLIWRANSKWWNSCTYQDFCFHRQSRVGGQAAVGSGRHGPLVTLTRHKNTTREWLAFTYADTTALTAELTSSSGLMTYFLFFSSGPHWTEDLKLASVVICVCVKSCPDLCVAQIFNVL